MGMVVGNRVRVKNKYRSFNDDLKRLGAKSGEIVSKAKGGICLVLFYDDNNDNLPYSLWIGDWCLELAEGDLK